MSARELALECQTPKCIEHRARYKTDGRVYPNGPNGAPRCDGCGGVYRDGKWTHTCERCGKEVEPGQLVGLFVPHNCKECERIVTEQERAAGHICRMCRQTYNNCCC